MTMEEIVGCIFIGFIFLLVLSFMVLGMVDYTRTEREKKAKEEKEKERIERTLSKCEKYFECLECSLREYKGGADSEKV